MSKGTCAITGTTGFIGNHIARKMNDCGWSVIKMQRKKNQGQETDDKIFYYSIGDKLDPKNLSNVDILIHCAYDFSCNTWDKVEETNINGTKSLFEASKKAGVGLILFISSMHAFEGCRTMYGKAKLAIEKYVLNNGGIVIRPGTTYVEENGKLYGGLGGNTLQSFEKLFRITPIVPILYSNKPIIYTSNLNDLCSLIEEAATTNEVIDKPICAVNERPLTLKQFLTKIKDRRYKNKILFIPVPWQIPWLFLLCLEKIKINLPLKSDSILNFFDQNPAPDFSSLKHLKTRIRSF